MEYNQKDAQELISALKLKGTVTKIDGVSVSRHSNGDFQVVSKRLTHRFSSAVKPLRVRESVNDDRFTTSTIYLDDGYEKINLFYSTKGVQV